MPINECDHGPCSEQKRAVVVTEYREPGRVVTRHFCTPIHAVLTLTQDQVDHATNEVKLAGKTVYSLLNKFAGLLSKEWQAAKQKEKSNK